LQETKKRVNDMIAKKGFIIFIALKLNQFHGYYQSLFLGCQGKGGEPFYKFCVYQRIGMQAEANEEPHHGDGAQSQDEPEGRVLPEAEGELHVHGENGHEALAGS
jgi:hypothetical protein